MKTIKNARLTRIVVLAMVICMAVSLLLPTTALAANAAVNDAKNGVVQVRVTYTDDAGSVEDLFSGTGFLINDNTVLTCNHVVTLTAGELAALAEVYQKTVPEFQSRLKIAITVSRDVTIDATVINSSATMDFAILRLSTSLQGKKALAIRSSATVEQTEHVFAIGFPDISSDSQSFCTYTSEDATIAEGVVNKNGAYFDANVKYLQTSCELDFGNSGGPMVDENGNVIGLCAGYLDSAASAVYFAVCIDQVTEVLSALGIPYTPATSQPVEIEPTTEPTTEPTEEEPPATTVPVLPPHDIPDDFVDNDPVEPKSNMGLILIIAAVAVAVVVIIVVVIVASGKKKKPVAPPMPPAPPAPPMPSRGGFEPAPTTPIQGVGETTVLNAGAAGETTVLSRNVNGGTLIRKRTGETVNVNQESFVIGRERKDVNYCIADNTAVSRIHAKLIVRNGVTYLTSMTDKNGTFVNNTKVMRNQEVALKNGDHITLANEELEYRN